MIPRYSRPEMAALWTEASRFRNWLRVEIEVCAVLAGRGEIPADAYAAIRDRAGFDVDEIRALEETTRHDLVAFLGSVARRVGPAARYVHLGLTSSDVVDTALGLQLRDAADLLIADLEALLAALRRHAEAHRGTLMAGRTHGMHAEPTSWGLKTALWYAETRRNLRRLRSARAAVAVGKISGAVGTFAHLPPEVEEEVCERLGLRPEPVSSQVIPRDRVAEYLAALGIAAASLEKFATEIRHLQRTEVGEVEEPFRPGQRGSSSMPHKRNPVGCEQITGLARLVRAAVIPALEDVALWHERDISHSSVERVILPDASILLDYMLNRFREILEGLTVNRDRMAENLRLSGGRIASQCLLLRLVRAGVDRERGHEWVQAAAQRSREGGIDFREAVEGDAELGKHLTREEIRAAFDWSAYLGETERIYRRVFREETS
ncbi:MAG: adenylosuccinate lyase [Acidobacteria bacterium]|nr:adenylosuccinate lyase [Acidobacteriota bacterium]